MKYFIFIIFLIIWVGFGIVKPELQGLLGSFFSGVVFARMSEFFADEIKRKGGERVK